MNMYIPIRDENNFMIKHYQYLFNKYWDSNTQVYFLGYKNPDFQLDGNIHFISLAEKRNTDPNAWSNKIIDYFQSIDDDFFYFSLEDYLPIRPVNLELLNTYNSILDDNIGRVDLWWTKSKMGHVTPYKEVDGIKFMKMSQSAPQNHYRVSSSNSIYNRKWFLKTLERNVSVHRWEGLANSGKHHNDGYDVITTSEIWTPTIVHALSQKLWGNKINVDGMYQEDIDRLKDISSEDDRCKEFFIYEISHVYNLNN